MGAGLPELPDDVDNDCDGDVDEGTALFDDDGDGSAESEGDCDDTDPLISPSAPEACDGIDRDCDGTVDDLDLDGDGSPGCGVDCDDLAAAVHPGAVELPDGVDQDCDGTVDEGTVLYDDDGDGTTELQGDCDDGDAAIGPHAAEVCNAIDDDCDPGTSELADRDGDGSSQCTGDCDDTDADIGPSVPEQCDGVDQDCDGQVDDDCSACAAELLPGDDVQAALDGTAAGDTVCLGPGEYSGPVALPAWDLTLIGLEGSASTTLRGDSSSPVLTVPSSATAATRVQGLTLLDGGGAQGGGLRVWGDAQLVDLAIADSEATEGAGIALLGSDALLQDIQITSCVGTTGVLYVDGGAPTLERVALSGNSADYGPSLWALDADLLITDLSISNNQAAAFWAGPRIDGGTADILGLSSRGNTSLFAQAATDEGAGGLALTGGAVVELRQTIIEDNADRIGGILVADGSSLVLEYARIVRNSGFGGSALLVTDSTLDAAHVALIDNGAAVTAGPCLTTSGTVDFSLSHALITGCGAWFASVGAFSENGPHDIVGAIVLDNYSDPSVGLGIVIGQPAWRDSVFWLSDAGDSFPDPAGSDGNTRQDPQLLDTSPASREDWDLHLSAGSPVVDSVSPGPYDPDGSIADPGLYGGAGADGWDLDRDGIPAWWAPGPWTEGDCDDLDPARSTGCAP